ncbi:hypothetical protein [Lysinibacillus sp. BW-2-10]|uniref:hypothetical protein n=1 Tax=Lysinibacillus sp. BW-2-10 TaxID=2590030 RepID=UPI001180004F|nr:hypothetical protein [Lysinibacillus sp. BW-2-10]TSI11484.1 hypothetical protein FJQ64_01455 [Lysinibacillus sp. BW-2-10]
MDYAQLEKMISQTVKKVVANYVFHETKLLVIHPNSLTSRNKIERLRKSFHIHEWQGEPIDELLDCYDFIVFLEVDQSFIVNSAQGIIHTPAAKLLSQFIIRDVATVLVPNDEFLTYVIRSTSNRPYISMLRGYVENLRQYGCTICEFSNVKNLTHRNPSINEKELITESTIKEYKNSILTISENTIITPLALDTAKQKGITIKYE